MGSNIKKFKCLIHYNGINRDAILHEDLTYTMLHEMVMKKFNLEANYPLNLSAKLSSIDDNFDITDDHEIQFFVECACNSKDEVAHLYVSKHKALYDTTSSLENMFYDFFEPTTLENIRPSNNITNMSFDNNGLDLNFGTNIPETPLYKSKPMISKDYKKETNVKVGQNFNNKDALDLAIRLKGLDEGYQFLNERSAPERHAAIALVVQNEFPLAYHVDIQPDAYDKLCQVGSQRWLKAHCPLVHYNYLTSNSVESVNACTVVYRKLPVIKLAETYRAMVQDWFTSPPRRSFIGGLVATVDPVELKRFLTNQVKRILTYSLGYDENSPTFLYLRKPNCSFDPGLVKLADALQDRNMLLSNPENVRSNVLMKLQDALDEEAILEEQILTLMHRFADRFMDQWGPCRARVRANRLFADSDTLSQASYESVGPSPNCEGTAQAQKPGVPIIRHQVPPVYVSYPTGITFDSLSIILNLATRLGFLLLYFTMSTIRDIKSKLNPKALDTLCTKNHIPASVHPSLPGSDKSILQSPDGKIGVYSRFFDFANYRLLLSQFLVDVLGHFRIHLSQLSVFGAAKVSHFEILCRVHGFQPFLNLFRARYYTLDENSYPTFWDGDEGGYILSLRLRFCFIVIIPNTFVVILIEMDLFAFIRHYDPTKEHFAERDDVQEEVIAKDASRVVVEKPQKK
ncbi:hypothetical protein Tco_1538667 [Tanacetum coccineum]